MQHLRFWLLSEWVWSVTLIGKDTIQIISLKKINLCFTLQTNGSILFIEQKAAHAFKSQGPSVPGGEEKWLGLFWFLSQ